MDFCFDKPSERWLAKSSGSLCYAEVCGQSMSILTNQEHYLCATTSQHRLHKNLYSLLYPFDTRQLFWRLLVQNFLLAVDKWFCPWDSFIDFSRCAGPRKTERIKCEGKNLYRILWRKLWPFVLEKVEGYQLNCVVEISEESEAEDHSPKAE